MATSTARGNRLLPVLAIVVGLMALYVGYRALKGERAGIGAALNPSPTVPDPDADTPAETLRTLTAKVAQMTREVQALQQENVELAREREDTEQRLRRELKDDLTAAQARQQPDLSKDDGLLQSVMKQLQDLRQTVATIDIQPTGPQLPVGTGWNSAGAIVWIEPLDGEAAAQQGYDSALLQPVAYNAQQPAAANGLTETADPNDKPPPIPVYTIAKGTGLVDATGWTALIGRIPIDGRVDDPYPFKVLIGAENLAANGIDLPDVAGAIAGGTAVGDFNLHCVRSTIDYFTFIFHDGTIRTVSAKDTDSGSLGYLSDHIGDPCVSGRLITNASAYLTNRILLGAAETGAYAAAASETTTAITPEFGTAITSVTGDKGRYVAGKVLAGGVREAREWLDARMGQSFDAVFAPAGTRVAIHIEEPIAIDYEPAPAGRKANHVLNNVSPFQRPYLD
jgi:integrating conjugative element protein (TIGR03752 family)